MFKYFKFFFLFILLLFIFLNSVAAEEILTWGDCLTEAKKNNPNLISAEEAVNAQKAGKTITASSLYPQINGSADASNTRTSMVGKSNSAVDSSSYSYGITGRQLIFNGLKTINDVKSASENVKASEQAYRFTSSEVRLNLRSAFINLLKTQELIKVSEEIVKIRNDNLMLINLQYQSGLEHKGARLTAEANFAEAEFELSQAKRNVEFAQRQLTKQMGRTEFKKFSVKGEFTVSDIAKEKPDFEDMVKNNPSILEAEYKKNSAAYSIKSAYGNFLPEISGSAGTQKGGSDWPPKYEQWNLGLSLTMPIFEGGLRTAQVSQAQAQYRQAEAEERNTRDATVVALEQTWASLQDAIETVGVQSKSLEAAQERSKIAEAQYSTGFINFDNWIIIENDLVSAKKAYLQAQANALLAEANWVQAKGETLEYAQ